MLKKLAHYLTVPESEYRANLTGVHSFFGTVLGLVLVGTEQLSNREFFFIMAGLVLVLVAILNISTPNRRLLYTSLAFALTFALPRFADAITGRPYALSDKIYLTLIMWICLTMSVEFYPRRADTVDPMA